MSVKIGKLISHGNGGPDITNIGGNVEVGEMEVGYKITKFEDIEVGEQAIVSGEVYAVGDMGIKIELPYLDSSKASYVVLIIKKELIQ